MLLGSGDKTKSTIYMKIAIYEDNDALRDSLSHLISGIKEMEFCGAYPDCSSIIENCTVNKPDIILMDIDMPGISGIEATILVKKKFPEINIMMLTIFEDRDKIFEALCAGATGYLLKKTSAIQIIQAITDLYEGGSPMTGEIARKVMEFFSKPKNTIGNDYQLSNREMDILKCLVKGDSYKMIADHCFISIGTVRTHINSIYHKLQVNSKSEAIIKAMNERLV
jgi:DNA-binding NarL/FixJ family response regulator